MSLAHLSVILAVLGSAVCGRDFAIDYETNTFLKDGEAFRFVSGSLNYFNVPHGLWEQRLRSMRLGGVNVLQTAIEWRSHEPQNASYSFAGQNDVIRFIQMAHEIGFLVNVQIGPFIDLSRDMGGLPWWLLNERAMRLRTSDTHFLSFVDRWFAVLLPKLKPLLYRAGGPIILVQLENQYGSSGVCDRNYTDHLFGVAEQLLGNGTVFVTSDVPADNALNCGRIHGCLATVSFGLAVDPAEAIKTLRRNQPKGPLVNSAFSTADADEWGRAHHPISNATAYAQRLEELLSLNMSVNIAMFHGGTQWYFDSGAKLENGTFSPFTTSFDMDAPLNEAGDPTPKFFAVKNVIKKWIPGVNESDPQPSLKMSLRPIKTPLIFDYDYVITHMEAAGLYKTLQDIDSMESVGFDYGLVAYSTVVASVPDGTAVVTIEGVRDRGYVYLNGKLQSVVDRAQNTAEVTLQLTNNSRLDILVENQGRISNDVAMHDCKGLIGNVTIGNRALSPWKIYQLPRTSVDLKTANRAKADNLTLEVDGPSLNTTNGFGLYGNFFILEGAARDTFLKLNGFSKGYVWLNGNHLGRYWPSKGPQQTLFVPSIYFNASVISQEIVILEQEQSGDDPNVEFVDKPIFLHSQ